MKHTLSPKRWFLFVFVFLNFIYIHAQEKLIQGTVIDQETKTPLSNVKVQLKDTPFLVFTDISGSFTLKISDQTLVDHILVLSYSGYVTKRFPIYISETAPLYLGQINLQYDRIDDNQHIAVISLGDEKFTDDEQLDTYYSGVLQASKDVFLSAAAYDFSSTFFRPRGLGNEYGKVLINGLEMNKMSNGRPHWNTWGGLNDVLRNQSYDRNLSTNEVSFGDLGGTTQITLKASQYKKGGRVSYAFANRSYTGRVMGSYHSGVLKNGWAYAVLLSKRFGDEGLIEGTSYDANAMFISVEKNLNKKHQLNLTGFYTPVKRGKSTAITDEIFNLKGRNYNPNWGYFNQKKVNARTQVVQEPIFMLNHSWQLGHKTKLTTNLGFQTGTRFVTRLDNGGTDMLVGVDGSVGYSGGGRSKYINPMHPEHLPSFYIQNSQNSVNDYQKAYLAAQEFRANGQINWNEIFATNTSQRDQFKNATYVLLHDKIDDIQYAMSSNIYSQLNQKFTVSGGVAYTNLKSHIYAEIGNMLGGTGFLDIDGFARYSENQTNKEIESKAQNNLKNPNRIVSKGDHYKYNFELLGQNSKGFLQLEGDFKKINIAMSAVIANTTYQRLGLYENGYFPENKSFGASKKVSFIDYGIKTSCTAKFKRNMFLATNLGYFTKAPVLEHSFVNARQNNFILSDITKKEHTSEKISSIDVSYIIQQQKLKLRLSGYYNTTNNVTDISYYYTEAIDGEDTGLVQEILTGVDKQYLGGELGVSYQILPTLRLKTAAALGQHAYANTPNLWLTSTSSSFDQDNGIKNMGNVYLKNYRLSGGPQTVAQFGFDYRDPDFWWFGTSINYYSDAYIGISALARTDNFYKDSDGLPFNEYDPQISRSLLKQEQFEEYMLVNMVGGKSWRVKNYTLGFFASINNVLDQLYKTGGFESSRRASYRLALEESKRDTPLYGSRYFYGPSTAYYLNFYCRF
ncbi:carboxypeptidase-like regulatory domain-containing protein [Aquimarina sp. W85]|uniref:carboxypeptidase-like regulatory domain-containing protein n=1 Tax=Aquimarina rhodophyticola TaxID=3342246 RepID=UPI00366A5912